jgi:hypothetical protein
MTIGMQKQPKTFKHSGDLGDIIFSLPTIKALGGGILYLDPKGGEGSMLIKTEKGNRTKLNENSINSIMGLLLCQSYITGVRFWNGEEVDYNLDQFRLHVKFNNLADSHLNAFGLGFKHRDDQWLKCPIGGLPNDKLYIFSRSCRYQGNHGFWGQLVHDFTNNGKLKQTVFIGHPKEHELFEFTFDTKVEYIPTLTLLHAAELIQTSSHLYCNQSVIHAIGEGLKVNLTQEVYRPYPATIFHRPKAEYV